jgi:hypothetical protein
MATTSTPYAEQAVHRSRPALIAGLALIAAGVVLLAGCTGGSSTPTVQPSVIIPATQTRSVAQFSRLDLAGSNNVTVTVGERQSVVVHADSKLINDVTTRVVDGTLTIADTGSFTAPSPMSVEVSVPSLAALEVSGSGQISVSGIKAQWLTVTISGNGLLYATGSAAQLDVTLNGEGAAQLNQLVADNVSAFVTGSGLIEVTATASLVAVIPGDGAIIYGGNPPQVTTSVTGTGTVTRV